MKIVLAVISAIVIILLSIILVKFRNNDKYTEVKGSNEAMESLEIAWTNALMYSGNLRINDSLELESENGTIATFKDVLKSDINLVLRVNNTFCIKCLDKEIPILLEQKHWLKLDQVIIITNRMNFGEIIGLKHLKNIPFRVFAIDDRQPFLKNEVEQNVFFKPYYFAVGTDLIAKYVYQMESSNTKISKNYFNILNNVYRNHRNKLFTSFKMKGSKIVFDNTITNLEMLKLDSTYTRTFFFQTKESTI